MSYISDTSTRDEFLASKSAINTRKMAESSLTQFGRFTQSEYDKTPEEILADLKDDEKALEKKIQTSQKRLEELSKDE